MKRALFICTVLLVSIISHGQTNIYQPFPNDSAVWFYNHTGGISSWEEWLGDTIINSVSYKKIFNKWDNSAWYYSGGIRQDIPNEKVYRINLNNVEEDVSDNQHLAIGDSLPNPPAYPGKAWIIVKIDSTLVGTKYHKRYKADAVGGAGLYTCTYVVGVGTEYYQGWDIEYSGLVCFSVNNINLLGTSSNCQLVSIEDPVKNENSISIFPNPFSTQATLSLGIPSEHAGLLFKNASLTVYNSYGETVKQINNFSGQTIIIHRDNLPGGLYFVRLTQDGKIFPANKFVITDK